MAVLGMSAGLAALAVAAPAALAEDLDRRAVYDELIGLQSSPGHQDELIGTLKSALAEKRAGKLKLTPKKEAEYRDILAQLLYDKNRPMEALQTIRATPARVRTASSRLLESSILEDLRGRAEVSSAEWAQAGIPEPPPASPLAHREWVASASAGQSESLGSGGGGLRYAHPIARDLRLFGDVDGLRYQTDTFRVENRLRTVAGLEYAGPRDLIFRAETGYLWNTPGIGPQLRGEAAGTWLGANFASLGVSLADENASSADSLLAGVSETALRLYWERQVLPTLHITTQTDLKLASRPNQFAAGRGVEFSARFGFSTPVDPKAAYAWAAGPWVQATAWRTDSASLNQVLTDDSSVLGAFARFGRSTGSALLTPSFNFAAGLGRDFVKAKSGINAAFFEGNLAGRFSRDWGYSAQVGVYFEELSSFRTGGGTKIGRLDVIWTMPTVEKPTDQAATP